MKIDHDHVFVMYGRLITSPHGKKLIKFRSLWVWSREGYVWLLVQKKKRKLFLNNNKKINNNNNNKKRNYKRLYENVLIRIPAAQYN